MIASPKKSTGQGTSEGSFQYSTTDDIVKQVSPGKKKTKARILNINANELNSFILSHKIHSEVKVTTVNIKAVRDFIRSYKHIPDPKWFKTEGGYIASFPSKGIFRKIAYDEKGRWLYNLLEYTEAGLAFEIRDMVKSRYYDHDILVVHQYEFEGKTIYLIRMQDRKSNIVTLKVFNGDMEVITPHEKN